MPRRQPLFKDGLFSIAHSWKQHHDGAHVQVSVWTAVEPPVPPHTARLGGLNDPPGEHISVVTILDKELKRQITVDGVDYTVRIDSNGFRLVGKGKRKPEVQLRWRELLSGEAAMAVALNASLSKEGQAAVKPPSRPAADRAAKCALKGRQP